MVNDKFYNSISFLPDQCQQAFSEAGQIDIPDNYCDARSVVFCGMGGSALGPEIIGDVFGPEMKVPYLVNREYDLPFQLNEKVLVVLSSYSGTTEEVLSCGREGLEKGAKVLAITTGGDLENFAQENSIPYYKIIPEYNPSGQPRIGIGYSIFGILGMLNSLRLCSYAPIQLKQLAGFLNKRKEELEEKAKETAESLKGKIPVLISSGHLRGAVHAFNNCINESSKSFSAYFCLPEMGHHLLEGLQFPAGAREILKFVLVESGLYLPRVQQEMKLVKEIVEQYNYPAIHFIPQAKDKLAQAMEVVLFGEMVSFYLSQSYGVDPTTNPCAEEFKKRLLKWA